LKTHRSLAAVCAFAVAFSFSSMAAVPQDTGSSSQQVAPAEPSNQWMFANLNLTSDQKAKIQALNDERKAKRVDHAEEIAKIRRQISTELEKEKPDNAKLMAYAGQEADCVEKMTKQHIEQLMKLKEILTKEQFDKLLSRQWRLQQHREMRQARHHIAPPDSANNGK
jgi:Spy/CpxP family protein refolding chaperone